MALHIQAGPIYSHRKSFNSKSSQCGQAMSEYVIVTMFLSMLLWFAIAGVDWSKPEPTTTEDSLYYGEHAVKGEVGLVQAIHGKQNEFTNSIYKP